MKKKKILTSVPVSITGRHFSVTPELREYAERKVGRLQKYFDRMMEARVIITNEKLNQVVEINISANGFSLSGKGRTPDVFASVDQVIEKMERQLVKHRDKIHERKRLASKAKIAAKDSGIKLSKEIEEEMFEEHAGDSIIVKIEKVTQKPMSPDEAALQMDLIRKPFLAFINSRTDELNVIYRRSDGHYGLIQRK